MRRSILTVVMIFAATSLALPAAAHAQGGPWPVDGAGWPIEVAGWAAKPAVISPDRWTTPDQLEFWNPAANVPRLVSPYGTSTRTVCVPWRTLNECWQADRDGVPHKLTAIPGPTSMSTSQVEATYLFPFVLGS